MSDYYFVGADGLARQYSRKQAGELLGNMDEAETQLRKYYEAADFNYQIVEGIISEDKLTADIRRRAPTVRDFRAKTFGYQVDPIKGYLHGSSYNCPYSKLKTWEFRLYEDAGIVTFHTTTYVETVKMLVCHYKSATTDREHTTMQRYIRPRLQLKEHDPFVMALMSVCHSYGVKVGEEKAKAMKDAGFNSLLDVAMASENEIMSAAGLGRKLASDLLKAVGRRE